MFKRLIFTILVVLAVTARPYAEEGEVRAKAGLGVAYLESADNLSAGSNRSISGLDQEAPTRSRLLPVLVFDLRYVSGTPGEDSAPTEYYIGNMGQEPGGFGMGAKGGLGRGTIDLSAHFSSFSKVWENPYQAGPPRTATDLRKYGLALSYNGPKDFPAGVSYAVSFIDVDKDLIGEQYSDLRRDGTVHTAEFGYGLGPFRGARLRPSVFFELGDFEGKSESYTKTGPSIGLNIPGRVSVFARLSSGFTRYEKEHPLFGKKRRDTEGSLFASIIFAEPLGIREGFATIGFLLKRTDSNIDFFDSEGKALFVTLGRKL